MAAQIDLTLFRRRLPDLYNHWRLHKDKLWGSASLFVVATPNPSEDLRYLKSLALSIWLFGCEFPETIMIFTDTHIHFICSKEQASLLAVVIEPAKESADVVVDVKEKQYIGFSQMYFKLQSIHSEDVTTRYGYIAGETSKVEPLSFWVDKWKSLDRVLSDITSGLSDLLAVKDEEGISCIKRGACLITTVMNKYVIPEMEVVIDRKRKATHASLLKYTKESIMDVARRLYKSDVVCTSYPPTFLSSGEFTATSSSNNQDLYYDSPSVIICAIGARLNGYCSDVARTFLINPNGLQIRAYRVLHVAHAKTIGALKPGRKISDVYEVAVATVKENAPDLVPNLTKSAGRGIGLELHESGLTLNAENEQLIVTGMVFNVSLGFQNLKINASKPKSHNFSMHLADTVVVGDEDNGNFVATKFSSKSVEKVSYSFEEEELKVKVKSEKEESVVSKETLGSDKKRKMREEELRKRHAEFARQKSKETVRCLVNRSGNEDGTIAEKTKTELMAYKGANELGIKLYELGIRLPFKELALTGTLEAHMNCLQYSTTGNDKPVHIMYANIKHGFFQPSEKEMITLLHFNLNSNIMVGTNKTKDVQFFVEVMKTGAKGSAYDPGQIVEGHMGRGRKYKINAEFQKFVNQVHDLQQIRDLKIKFEQPLRNCGFYGVADKKSSFIVPTSNCLVELIDNPFVVITMNEIKIIILEGVGLVQKNDFDLVVVFKDFNRLMKIDLIPYSSLDGIKKLLGQRDIEYYESRSSLEWHHISEAIRDFQVKYT